MSVVFGGRKAGEMYYEGRKIREAWYEGQRVYTAGSGGKPVEVMPRIDSYWGANDWLINKVSEYGEDYRTVAELPFEIDVSQAGRAAGMFQGCNGLVVAPRMDTRHIENMEAMFRGCKALVTVLPMNIGLVTEMPRMFAGCASLTDGNVHLVSEKGTKPRYRDDMLFGSSLTREPFFTPDGRPID